MFKNYTFILPLGGILKSTVEGKEKYNWCMLFLVYPFRINPTVSQSTLPDGIS